jgi:hypothetical protein
MLLQIDEEKIRTKLEERPTAYVASPHNVETQKPDYAVPSTVVTSSTFGLPPNLEAARDRLIALRERILREGGRTFSWDDVEAEVRGARGRE